MELQEECKQANLAGMALDRAQWGKESGNEVN
ncbi:unnamed protein product [Anisakis simplex]|uniref:Recombinase n=1 Tax=Anisakis simplex TaxID=6269 RepID=A0A0M3J5K7_ANISI|nr:unnamed protein product [Anisakis simplex]